MDIFYYKCRRVSAGTGAAYNIRCKDPFLLLASSCHVPSPVVDGWLFHINRLGRCLLEQLVVGTDKYGDDIDEEQEGGMSLL